MKHVVSISLGTSTRDKRSETEFLGEKFLIERLGTDGAKEKYKHMVCDLDGKVDCFGIGGTDAYLYAGSKRYAIRETKALMRGAKITPWVDGSGLKHTLERETIGWLQSSGALDFSDKTVLLMSAVDRFGMAEALNKCAKSVIYGDLIYGLGVKVPLRKYSSVKALASVMLPVISQLPVSWFYPTGKQQEVNKPSHSEFFAEADVIAGDWHIIRRHMPENLKGKIILTQSSRAAETELLRERGVKTLITTTPPIGGESFATNVMEAVLVTVIGKKPSEISPEEYLVNLTRR